MKKINPKKRFGKMPDKLTDALVAKFGGKQLSSIERGELTFRVAQMNKKLDELLMDEKYVEYLDPDLIYISDAEDRISSGYQIKDYKKEENVLLPRHSVKRYFNKKNNPPLSRAYALAAFAGFKPYELPYLKEGTDSAVKPELYKLIGGWDSYLYDSNEEAIKKTRLWISILRNTKDRFKAEFAAPWNVRYDGIARVSEDRSLIIELKQKQKDSDQPIFICSKLPELSDSSNLSNLILNAGGLTSGRINPVLGNLIFVKNDEFEKSEAFLEQGVEKVKYIENFPVKLKNRDFNDTFLLNQIIIYLTRYKDRPIHLFTPNNASRILQTNEESYIKKSRQFYKPLKELLFRQKEGYVWYSFSRIIKRNDRVGIFQWEFDFDETRQEVIARRHRIGFKERRFYAGEVTIESDHLYIRLHDRNKDNRKNFISDIPEGDESVIKFRGLSATTAIRGSDEEPKRIALREILIYMPEKSVEKNQELDEDFIGYKNFLSINEEYLNRDDKLYLAQRNQSTITFPTKSNPKSLYTRQARSIDHAGKYYVFIRNIYGNNALFVLTLEIDKVGVVNCEIPYKDKIYKYSGVAEAYAENLHIRLEYMPNTQSKEKILNLSFDSLSASYMKKVRLYSGIALDTDDNSYVGSYPFIMLPENEIKLNVFSPFTIEEVIGENKNHKVVLILADMMASNLFNSNINDYFFKNNPVYERFKLD